MPLLAPVGNAQGCKASTHVRVENGPARIGLTGLPHPLDLGHCREDVQPIRGHPPLDASVGTALTQAPLTHNLALFRGIERQTIPDFCPANSSSRPSGAWVRIGEEPRSKSGPQSVMPVGQLPL